MIQNQNSLRKKIPGASTLASLITLLLLAVSSFTPLNDPPKLKSRFMPMVVEKRILDSLMMLDSENFGHFIFQCTNNDKDGLLKRRRVYMLVVFACRKDGTVINEAPYYLEPYIGKLDKEATDRKEQINLANYTLSKRQYEGMFEGRKEAYGLKFDPLKPGDSKQVHKGYITYQIRVLNKKEDVIGPASTHIVDYYLKPSPPARPEP